MSCDKLVYILMSSYFRQLLGLSKKLLCIRPKALPPKQPIYPCAMDVTGAAFPQEVIKIVQHISDSRFISFDLEFSGVAGRRPAGGAGKLALQDYYHDLRSAAQIYQILQVGLTIVTEDVENARYVARPYNFNLCPLPATKESVFRRVWSYNSGAISFLMRNGFNMDKPIREGVQYLSRQEEDQVRKKSIEDDQARSNIPDMTLKDEDAVLVDHITRSIKDWQALPKEKQEPYLNIPAEGAEDPIPSVLNRYQVRMTHQIVRGEYPSLKTQGMGHFVQITNPTTKQQANEKELREQSRERDIGNAIGFRWIIEAMAGGDVSKMPHYYVKAAFSEGDEPKDIQGFLDNLQARLKRTTRAFVGHNCLTDLINLYRCFIGDLPEHVEEFSDRLHELFPVILDTKYIAGLGNKRWADTSLKSVEDDLSSVAIPQIHLPPSFDRYLYEANYHEAGFDSFVTAKIGVKMAGKLKREGKDIKALIDPPPPANGKVASPIKENDSEAATQPLEERGRNLPQDQKQGMANNVAEVITAPATFVKSILAGSENAEAQPAEEAQIRNDENLAPSSEKQTDSGTVIATKTISKKVELTKGEVKKLKSMSQKSNIFDMLVDEPSEAPEELTNEQKKAKEQKRIAGLVRNGQLMPRWEKDAEFWHLVGNKLQANACKEGILDLAQH